MTHKMTENCIGCTTCLPQIHCPTGAITVENEEYSINPKLCNSCEGYYDEPQCVVNCSISSPIPTNSKKGRYKAETRTPTSSDLFPDGKHSPFASSIVIWEACNILTQRQSLPWEVNAEGELRYQRLIKQGQGSISFGIAKNLGNLSILTTQNNITNKADIQGLDIRAACLHLIYAAHATVLDKPWEQEFVISDRQIEKYLGLEKRKDWSKATKLSIIKALAQQPCQITTSIDWPQQGRINAFSVPESKLWDLLEIQHHFSEDSTGCKHLIGLTFKIRAGIWAKYFLNREACKERTAFYQYGILPQSVLSAVMSIWQQHEGTARMLLWLLFKTKMGREQRLTVPTLMRVAYGEEKVTQAASFRDDRKRLLRTFESDLEVLSHYGLKPVFDPVTYPQEIQPMWAKLAALPDDGDEALDFWINDGSNSQRLTDHGPRGKWKQLMNARILWFQLPQEWEQHLANFEKQKLRYTTKRKRTKKLSAAAICGEQVMNARKSQQLSQRQLANMLGKSQSWIRDIENGRFQLKGEDQMILQNLLGLGG
ncbi:MAG: helix-turn-helix domain-containing protein [Microcoleaceae cyanobacterium MO_207.B10]|nr:helix-turn-helix domain-containing protein [Microcoleaceae cyanobacterium MO_207.B10]